MSASSPPRPTDGELAILRALWLTGPATVRQIHEQLQQSDGARRGAAYTTTLKLLQIMTEKRLVLRDDSSRSHVYRPAISEARTQKHLLTDLLDRAFGGSVQKLVLHALSFKPATRAELDEIHRLLDELKGGGR